MAKDKYDFIQELLSNSKLSSPQRERILLLTSAEIKRDKDLGRLLEERILRLEGMIGIQENLEITNEISERSMSLVNTDCSLTSENDRTLINYSLPKYFHPGSLYKYLFEYNQNTVLKSTCHEIDANSLITILEYCKTNHYDFRKHLNKITSAFEEHDKKYFCTPTTKALIRGYITGKDYKRKELKFGWSSDNIKINWNHSQLFDWARINKIPPNATLSFLRENKLIGFDFEGFTSDLFNKRVQTFRELVLHFKNLFHIRSDNSLKSILTKINKLKGFFERVDFEMHDEAFSSNIELFTDVDKLARAYAKVIELIIEQHPKDTKPKVNLSYFEVNNNVYLSIHHLNNTYNKSIQNAIERMGQTYTDLIIRQINGMCNFYLRAKFNQQGMAMINLWDGKHRIAILEDLDDFKGGVEHIFEFCKND